MWVILLTACGPTKTKLLKLKPCEIVLCKLTPTPPEPPLTKEVLSWEVQVWPSLLVDRRTSGTQGLSPWTLFNSPTLVSGLMVFLWGKWVLETTFRTPPPNSLQRLTVLLHEWVSITPGWLCTCNACRRLPRVLAVNLRSRARINPQRPGRIEEQKWTELLISRTTRMLILPTLRLRPTPLLTSPTTDKSRLAPFS